MIHSVKSGSNRRLRDFVEMLKPGIVRMCLITTAGGLWLAPGERSWGPCLAVLIGSALTVGGANVFNMVWERRSDRLMQRTRNRPVASGRVSPVVATVYGGILSLLGLLYLGLGTQALTCWLAAFALFGYVCVYTPLKSRTPLALVIGAVPGAVPPLLGWTAVTGQIDGAGLILFGILLIWQMPHFLAIALYRKADYDRAGIRVVPVVRGDRVAKIQAIAWAALLVPVSMGLTFLGITGMLYLAVATVLSLGFLGWSLTGLWADSDPMWARRFFFASLVYLPGLIVALVLDVNF